MRGAHAKELNLLDICPYHDCKYAAEHLTARRPPSCISPLANTLAKSGLPAMTPATALLEVMAVASSGLEARAWGEEQRGGVAVHVENGAT